MGKEIRRKIYDHLKQLGGSKLKEFLSCALKEVMEDQLVAKFTWHKQKDSEKFGDTKVSNIFFRAAAKCPLFDGPANKENYKQAMLEVLKSTKQRYRNKIKNSRQANANQEEIENRVQEEDESTNDVDNNNEEDDFSNDASDEDEDSDKKINI